LLAYRTAVVRNCTASINSQIMNALLSPGNRHLLKRVREALGPQASGSVASSENPAANQRELLRWAARQYQNNRTNQTAYETHSRGSGARTVGLCLGRRVYAARKTNISFINIPLILLPRKCARTIASGPVFIRNRVALSSG